MSILLRILGWAFGGLFLIIGLVALFVEPAVGIVTLLIGLVIIPPVTKALERRMDRPVPCGAGQLPFLCS